ncbi:tyrosine-type recombinase/integrase [Desulfopila inferna]|uniref:tyrosine-type recombinase/integrase n=1 Tax=Desulfopila inferna TaxID=468528 RepID=UPI00196634B5|nr:tyrosine-type recombinase/integrase [Desulfopila inferna]MBM9604103.1 tyrosine-type recombinase/integrase [Desulfopila inferna]
MPKLTVLQIRNFKNPGRLGDGMGLFFELTNTGIKRWIYRYKINGKSGKYTIGRYPEISLEQARKAHMMARALVKQGQNPAKARRVTKLKNIAKEQVEKIDRSKSFENITLEWIEQQRERWSRDHTLAVLATLRNDVFVSFGSTPVDVITPPEVLKVLRKIEARGSLEIARKVLQRMNAVFRYAIQTGRATYNPAVDMQGVLKSKRVEHMPAVFDKDLAKLLKDIAINQNIHINTKLALQFTALTACRSGEVRNARWSEIDQKKEEFHIPAERMKMNRAHIVPLSKQALAVINRAEKLWGTDGLIFPSVRDQKKPMSDNAMSKALRDMGYKGIATPHGFRSSFSSMAYERSGFPSEVIEKSLAHEEKNKIKGAYNRAEYLEQRRQLMQWWGDLLQALEYGSSLSTDIR